MVFEQTKRRALIVYLKNPRQAKQLRRFGIVNYVSTKMKYASIYMNEADITTKKTVIERLSFVDHVIESQWPDVDTTVGSDSQDATAFTVDDHELGNVPATEEEL
ncbi:YlbG family protein [Weissella halotolerans]|uniref:Uncharacterized protein n=1 Tax=Weissella halotolerans DSM 20190 TaxID=1123500 RepID=A0A0R2FYQ1_9LACO|nr:YlbG family protein [Weissella halotolerans]KRN33615.1 hypothetical protein IV68_GL000422 [Weissella halotolerans DSM 20190]